MLEVDRVAENTQWNGRNVLDGSVDVAPAVEILGTVDAANVDDATGLTIAGHGLSRGHELTYHNGGGTADGSNDGDNEYLLVKFHWKYFPLASHMVVLLDKSNRHR